jgi:hypothetical protein
VVRVQQIVTRPQRPAQGVVDVVIEMHQGGRWGFFDNNAFLFLPASDADNPISGTYRYDQRTGQISFSGSRTIRTTTWRLQHAISGVIVPVRSGFLAQCPEEVTSVSAAVVNGQSFGQNKYRSSTDVVHLRAAQ